MKSVAEWYLDEIVSVEDRDCRLWMGSVGSHGYAETRIHGKYYLVHRLIWAYSNSAPIPGREYEVHHLCRTKRCLNPECLEKMLKGDHTAFHMKSSVCPQGHNKDIMGRARDGHCLECKREGERYRRSYG